MLFALSERKGVRDADFVRRLPVGVRHLGDNRAVPSLDPAALRVRRYLLLSGCQSLVYPYWRERVDKETGEVKLRSEFRVSICCREPVEDAARIYRNGSTVGFAGLMRCGNVWGCPICCAKVMRRRAEQIGAIFAAVHDRNGSAVMVTYTAAHTVADPLEKLLVGLKAAKRSLTQSRTYRHLAASRIGSVSATEITYGLRGWHAHQHDAWFFDSVAPDSDELADALFDPWLSALAKEGMSAVQFYRDRRTGEHRRVGVDVRAAWDASEYLTKFDRERNWSLAKEMTEGRSKQGRVHDSLTPWELLEDAIIRGKGSPAAALWIEYLRATKGKAAISLMPAAKLLKELGMPTRLDDFVDANSAGVGEVIGTISDHYFDRAVREGGLGSLLEAARNSALPELGGMLNFV